MTRITTFSAMYYWKTHMQFNEPKSSNLKSFIHADTIFGRSAKTDLALCEKILGHQQQHIRYCGGKDLMFEIEVKLYLMTMHSHITWPSTNLYYTPVGPYTERKFTNSCVQ
jgi:hypothetical protein